MNPGPRPGPDGQYGAALLGLMLLLMVGSTWLLLSGLNEHTREYLRRTHNELALNRARRALLSYAMNYPDLRDNPEKGPGFLPCPDRNNDGRPETNCAAGTGTTLGRLPFTILGLDDPRDSSGERLWYALSANFRNTRSNDTVVNSETPGRLSVDGVGDVVAVLIAPGEPVGAQYTRPDNEPSSYLEGDNTAIGDGSFTATAGNDQVAVISRAQLMAAVEQRVINEVRAALARYRAAWSAYPWLTPFADPRADNRALRGAHTGGNNAALLRDRRRDFSNWGVAANDIVRNLTDGSVAVVSTVAGNTLGVTGRSLGAENDFDTGDIYFIELRGLAHTLSGTAAAGSAGPVLKDADRDFRELGIVPGDVVENLTDASGGAITAVTGSTLTVNSLSRGSGSDFDFGEMYRIRSNTGIAAPDSGGLVLADPHADFVALGIVAGDVVENLTDGSVGRVHGLDGPTRLTVSGLRFGRNNVFSDNDVYRLPRYNGRRGIRKGLLSIHQPGKTFPTGFAVKWRLPASAGSVTTGSVPELHSPYAAAVRETIRAAPDGAAVSVNIDSGQCVWLDVQSVECTGAGEPVPYLEGVAASGSSASALVDPARDFLAAGVRPGSIVQPYAAVVTRVDSATTLGIRPLSAGGPGPAAAQYYRIEAPTRLLSGAVDAPDRDRLRDSERNFAAAGVKAGDLVENVADGSFGLITGVAGSVITAALSGGTDNHFQAGDEYKVRYAYVNRRRYQFRLRYRGSYAVRAAAGVRRRDVCLGYGADCVADPVEVALPYPDTGIHGVITGGGGVTLEDSGADFLRGNIAPGDTLFNLSDGSAGMITAVARHSLTVAALDGGAENDFDSGDRYRVGRPMVIIEDLYDSVPVARTGLSIAPGGARGAVLAGGMDYHLSEGAGELPPWFIKNRWHQLLYAGYGAGFAPGGSGACTPGMDCLTVHGPSDSADDREALVVSAGMPLPGQDRSSGAIADYYEAGNASLAADDVFSKGELTDRFNDQVAVVAP